jgi:DNA (cytosine-5)-methyltransferase 1
VQLRAEVPSLEEGTVRVGSLFSGIGGFDLGFERAGMDVAYSVEFDAKARGVLSRHWPTVPQYTDVRSFDGAAVPVDVLCGGFPCQDLSVAGRRAGLAGERSGLFFEFARIIGEAQPQWVVIENVPGLLSSQRGRDMGAVVGTLADLGYGVAWRVLDAQYFGVAQRRRRVFLVGHLGTSGAEQVLLEPDGVRRDPPARREAGAETAVAAVVSTLQGGGKRGYRIDAESDAGGHLIPTHEVSNCLQERGYKGVDSDMTQAHVITPTLTAGAGTNCMAPGHGGKDQLIEAAFSSGAGVRRLTPTECERLQGFPDGWTEGQADSNRYRQLGNAVCVPVAEWLGRRIACA